VNIFNKINLFWDIDPASIDIQTHKQFVLERILSRGDLDDVAWAKETYTIDDFKDVVTHSRSLDPRSRNFWHHYFGILSEPCTETSLNQTQSAFSKRS
jgi:hypothetical protein